MKYILLSLLLFMSAAALADDDVQDKLKQLETDLNGVRQEQQSVYQNYQMVRDMRLMEAQEGIPPKSQYPQGMDLNTPPPNFDEVFSMQMEREQRIRQYTDDLESMSERYLELEEERKTLLEQIKALKQQPAE
ncbi:MAG: hypothetical protein M0P59_07795 [Gallionella sp.]|jgi:septal ring factor EnvC (AmiA/AmiB activator)|nr:hypothetical protein [Gallionella sp.]MCK9354047.1 hypothetical protein [Gallionella sp.]